LRTLIATDAAREGLNLQRYCYDLFHFDLPWNPSRLEQRNGRIDRKLQPAPKVFCRYFLYLQRLEDRVLRRLVEKTETIRQQLGSAAPVLETRITELLARGIGRPEVDQLEQEIERVQQDEKHQRARTDLEPAREADKKLVRSLEQLRSQLERSRQRVGIDRTQLQRVVTYGLKLAGAPALRRAEDRPDAVRYGFDEEAVAALRDPELLNTLSTLRPVGSRASKHQLRPVAFQPPEDVDAETVQLHLEHPLVRRLLDRFINQGLVHHDLSRACLAVSPDAVPRVVLLGRLSLWGERAARLHEEIVRVAARWIEPEIRKTALRAYARDAERETMNALDRALDEPAGIRVTEGIQRRLLATASRDIQELLPELETRSREAEEDATKRLIERGAREAGAMRGLIEAQRQRIERELAKLDDPQYRLVLEEPAELCQRELDLRAWRGRLEKIDAEIADQPARIRDSYVVRARRLEPVGLVYLWPATG
jgi:hypothetical protein